VAEDRLENHRLFAFPGEELDVAVELLPVELSDRPEQGLVEVGQGHPESRIRNLGLEQNLDNTGNKIDRT